MSDSPDPSQLYHPNNVRFKVQILKLIIFTMRRDGVAILNKDYIEKKMWFHSIDILTAKPG
jgi:hypothetical protein